MSSTARLTKKILRHVQIMASDSRTPKAPRLCKVVHVDPETGRRGETLADDLKDVEAARRWIEAQLTMAPED